MESASEVVRNVQAQVVAALAARGPVVLAVSGGLDSMVLLDAALAAARPQLLCVATFDHGTGPAARDAAAFVGERAAAACVPLRVGRAEGLPAREASWRAARWRFLSAVARDLGARAVATAHTRDDHVETVAIRALRSAGPRGLAGLLAPDDRVCRPLLAVGRADVEAYARARGVEHRVDPSNASRDHLRNRLRHDLLPAIERARPGFANELLALAERSARWRAEAEALADALPVERGADGSLSVARAGLLGYDAQAAAVVWPALAARAGIVLDRRGTARLAEFTTRAGSAGRVIQLSQGVEVSATAQAFALVRRPLRRLVVTAGNEGGGEERPLSTDGRMPGWRFAPGTVGADAWTAWLPSDAALTVRAWRAGDRMRSPGSGAARRVKRFFGDAGVPGRARTGWPVVLAAGEIVWIPGVRRSDAATDRSGRPGAWYRCERDDC
jgi:tRNA(Ile)-lysidine synthase